MALFVKLDVTWVDNRKLNRTSMAGRGLHATALCIAKRSDEDGWISRVTLFKEGATDELIDELVELKLFESEGEMVRPWGWLKRNLTKDQIREIKTVRAKKANHRKWKHEGEFEECELCNPAKQPDDPPSPSLGILDDPNGSLRINKDTLGSIEILSDPRVSLTSLEVERELELESERELEAEVDSALLLQKYDFKNGKFASRLRKRFATDEQWGVIESLFHAGRLDGTEIGWLTYFESLFTGLNGPGGRAVTAHEIVSTATELQTQTGKISTNRFIRFLQLVMDRERGTGARRKDGGFKTSGERMREKLLGVSA